MINLDDQRLNFAIRPLNEHTTANTKISVPPGLVQGAAILRDTQLDVAGLVILSGDWLQLGSKRIDVTGNHGNTIAGLVVCADGEGDEAGAVAGEVVFAAGFKLGCPGVLLEDLVIR